MAAACRLAGAPSVGKAAANVGQCRDHLETQGALCSRFSSAAFHGIDRAAWMGSSRLLRPSRRTLPIRNVGWDPEGILAPPKPDHITRRKVMKDWAKDAEAKEKAMAEARKELERRAEARAARKVPNTNFALIEYLLDTEAQEIQFEIAKCRKRLDDAFFQELKTEISSLKFGVNQADDVKDRVVELEALEKVLKEGVEAHDKLTSGMINAKDRLTRLLTAKDKKATLIEMAGENELDRSLLALLDENIARAREADQGQAADFMEKLRGAVLKYLTV